MTTTTQLQAQPPTGRALHGIVARVAAQYDMEADDFARTMIATIFPTGPKAPTPTRAHVAALCIVASEYGLNPLIKQIYAFPDKSGGIVPVISVDGWYSVANRHQQFDGIEFAYQDDERGNVLACTATVYRKDRSHPTRVTEYVSECRRNTDPWTNQPRRMIRHRAAIQAIRVAFNIAALDPDEEERVPHFEVYPTTKADPIAKINEELLERTERALAVDGPKPMPVPFTTEDGHRVERAEDPEPVAPESQPAEETAAPRERARTPRGFATKAQRDEFIKLVDAGTVDNALVSSSLPEEPEALEDAFAAMSKDDAAALLVRCRAGEFTVRKGPQAGPKDGETRTAGEQTGMFPGAGGPTAFEL